MKTLLIPTEDHDAMPAVLEAARLVAQQFGGYMEGFPVRPSAGTYVMVEPVSSLAISGAFEGDTANQARAQFESFMQSQGVPQADREPVIQFTMTSAATVTAVYEQTGHGSGTVVSLF